MDKDTEEQSVEDMMAHVQLLELQAKRMQKLVEQRKQERTDMDMENVRMERQLKYLAEMAKENEEVEAEYQRTLTLPGVSPEHACTSAVGEWFTCLSRS